MRTRNRAVVALSLVLLAGCTSESDSGSAKSVDPAVVKEWVAPENRVDPIVADTDRTDPLAVGEAVAVISCTWSPTVDHTETAALLRAEPLLTPTYAATIEEPPRGASNGVFAEAAAKSAVSVAKAQQRKDIHDGPQSTPTTQYLAYLVEWTWIAPDEKPAGIDDPRKRTVYVTVLQAQDGTWLVDLVEYEAAIEGDPFDSAPPTD